MIEDLLYILGASVFVGVSVFFILLLAELKASIRRFDTVKGQWDKSLECLEWFWINEDADRLLYAAGRRYDAYGELEKTKNHAYENFYLLSEEIRKEVEAE